MNRNAILIGLALSFILVTSEIHLNNTIYNNMIHKFINDYICNCIPDKRFGIKIVEKNNKKRLVIEWMDIDL